MTAINNRFNSRGILQPAAAGQKFHITRHLPSPGLQMFIERYWLIRWDLRDDTPHTQETIGYPCVNLVFEADNTRIYGVVTGKFTRHLEGRGAVVGVKFRPGAFYPFLGASVSTLTDTSIAAGCVFGDECRTLEQAVFSRDDDGARIGLVEEFLHDRLPAYDENITLVNAVIDCIIANQSINRVEDVASRVNMSKRSLQRLFNQYIGASPKWVIRRFRLQEAAERLAQGDIADWPGLAVELGYFDQAHFIKDFKTLIGVPPTEYVRQLADDID